VLGALSDVPDAGALQAVEPLMQGETTEEAASAAVKIAGSLVTDMATTESALATVRPVLTKVIEVSRSGDTAKNAVQLLASLDDQAGRTWLVCGPFPMASDDEFEKSFAPEQGIDLQASYNTTIGKNNYIATWREIRAKENKVDFANFYETTNGGVINGAFVYALGYVYSPSERTCKTGDGQR
jgi:hypothetical protein